MALDAGAILARLGLDSTAFTTGMAKATAATKGLKKDAAATSTATTKMGANMKKAMLGISAALLGSVMASIKFNKEMSNIATLMPESTNRVVELKDRIQDLAIATGKSTSDIAGGAYQVVSAFGEAASQGKKLDITVRAAAAGMSTTTDALNLLSATTKGYGDTSDKAYQHAADLAFETVRMGQTTFPELASSVGKTIPIAARMNVTAEELYASFATLTGVTGSAAEVSTQLSGVLGAMIKPTTGMKEAIKEAGFATAEAMLKEKGLVESLKILIGQTDGTSLALGKLVRRKEALVAITALTGKSADVFTQKYKNMMDVTGATDRAWGAISEGINKTGFQFEQLKQKVIVFAQRLGDAVIPVLGNLAKIMSPVISIAVGLVKVINEIISTIMAIPTPIKALIAGFVGLKLVTIAYTAVMSASLIPMLNRLRYRLTMTLIAMGPLKIALAGIAIASGIAAKAFKSMGEAHDRVMGKIVIAAEKEKVLLDQLTAFRKQANDRDAALMKEAVMKSLELDVENYESRLRFQISFMKSHSKNFREFQNRGETAAKATIARTKEQENTILEILEAAREKHMQLILSENEFKRWQIGETYKKERQILLENKASKEELTQLEKVKQAELTQILKEEEEERKAIKAEALAEQKLMIQEYWEIMAAMQEERYEQFRLMDEEAEFEALMGREREIEEFRRHYEAQKEIIRDKWLNEIITTQTAQKELLKLRQQYNASLNKSDESLYQQWLTRMLEMSKKQREAYNSTLAVFTGYLNAKQKKLDMWYQNERKAIEQSKMTEEQKQAAIAALDDEYEERKTKIARKIAIAEKAQNIAIATMNVATAVTKALTASVPPFNYILAAAVALLGAKWISTIASTPLPMREGGMTGEKEGLAYLHPHEVIMPVGKVPEVINNIMGNEEGESRPAINIYLQAFDSSDLMVTAQTKLVPVLEDLLSTGQMAIPTQAVVPNV
jgi:TP901 family phage tail tape measure protein